MNQNVMTDYFYNSAYIMEILEKRAAECPNDIVFTFLDYNREEEIEHSITYWELASKAKRIAGYLLERGYQGKRAVLMYPDGIEFIIAFIGCLYAKCIAVPLYHFKTKRKAERLLSIISDADAQLLLTDSKNLGKLQGFLDDVLLNEHSWAATDLFKEELAECRFVPTDYAGADLAYLQYTSGSTSIPKGVMITHDNILHNMNVLRENFDSQRTSIGVSWIGIRTYLFQ